MSRKIAFKSAGLLALTVAAVFAGRASTKFAGATNLFVSTASGGCLQIVNASVLKFSTIGSHQATILTNGGANQRNVWETACNTTSGKKVFFKG